MLLQWIPHNHRAFLCFLAPFVWPLSMLSAFVFQMHFCYQPWVTLTETDGARSVRSYDISPTLCRSAGYTQKRLTENLKVPYYVGEQFPREFTGMNLKNLERTVEDDYVSNLRNNCWKEKQQSMFAKKPTNLFIKHEYWLLFLPLSVLGKWLKTYSCFLLLLIYLSWIN